MTRYVMTADLRRCIGCQTCTAACRHTNATPPGVQWRQVIDVESGEYPDVHRSFIPVGCQHCGDPPCMHVCPTTATYQRDDGLVEIDYEKCIGCGYCAVACPYQQRTRFEDPKLEYFPGQGFTPYEELGKQLFPYKHGTVLKCTFCKDRVDEGLEKGLKPGVDREATPACVITCPTVTRTFGDLDDPYSEISRMIAEKKATPLHPEFDTEPSIYYIRF